MNCENRINRWRIKESYGSGFLNKEWGYGRFELISNSELDTIQKIDNASYIIEKENHIHRVTILNIHLMRITQDET